VADATASSNPVLAKLGLHIAGAVNDAEDLHTVLSRAMEDE
jgi:hypothetical protein